MLLPLALLLSRHSGYGAFSSITTLGHKMVLITIVNPLAAPLAEQHSVASDRFARQCIQATQECSWECLRFFSRPYCSGGWLYGFWTEKTLRYSTENITDGTAFFF